MAQFCWDYGLHPAKGRMVVIYGNNGTAKTRAAETVFRWAIHVSSSLPLVMATEDHWKRPDAMFVEWQRFLGILKSGGWGQLCDCEDATLLILDDIGAEHDPSTIGQEKLGQILQNENQWRIITTNKVPDAWEEAFGRRVASRLFRNSTQIDLSEVPDFSTL